MAATAVDLYRNKPSGVCRFLGVKALEGNTFLIQFRVKAGGEPVDFTGCTVDYARIDTGIGPGSTSLMVLETFLGADGVVTLRTDMGAGGEALVDAKAFPEGRRCVLMVRLKDPSTWPFFLIAPSWIVIKNGPGANA